MPKSDLIPMTVVCLVPPNAVQYISQGGKYKVVVEDEKEREEERGESEPSPLEFPSGVISGFAGEFARIYSKILEPRPPSFFIAALTCLGSLLSGKVRLNSALRVDPRLYVLLLGMSGSAKKSTAIDKSVEFFADTLKEFKFCEGVGSAEGLYAEMNSVKWDRRLLLCYDEFQQFVNKCKIESSVLLQMVNTLFEKNRYQNRVKRNAPKLEDAHLALLSASTEDTYEKCWEQQFTAIGFNNRLFILPCDSEREQSIPPPIADEDMVYLQEMLRGIIETVGSGVVVGITDKAYKMYDEWYKELPTGKHSIRIDTYALRLALLLTVNDNRKEIGVRTIKKVIKLCNWQLKVRQRYDPLNTDNAYAMVEAKIRRVLLVEPNIPKREIHKKVHAERCGVRLFESALQNLRESGEIGRDGEGNYYLILDINEGGK